MSMDIYFTVTVLDKDLVIEANIYPLIDGKSLVKTVKLKGATKR